MNAVDLLRERVTSGVPARIVGMGTRSQFLHPWSGKTIATDGLRGVVSHDVADQVVEVWAGTPLDELQAELAAHGQCLPLSSDMALPATVRGAGGSVGGLLAMDNPHALSSQCGGPRDWTLGMTVMRSDGTIATCGSKVVKSVAGYDAHKLFVGSRGSLGLILRVNLRTFPLRALPRHALVMHEDGDPLYIARTLRTDFATTCLAVRGLICSDPASCTLWTREKPELPAEAWMIGPNGQRVAANKSAHERRAKNAFDAGRRFVGGWDL